MRDDIKKAVQDLIKRMMDRVMNNVLRDDPFISEEHRTKKPLYAALVPDEIFKGAHFERRFVTPFGTAWELLAVAVAKQVCSKAERNYAMTGLVKSERLRRIQEVLNELEHPSAAGMTRKPNWDVELSYILEGAGEDIPVAVICDIYIERNLQTKGSIAQRNSSLSNIGNPLAKSEEIIDLHAMDARAEVSYAVDGGVMIERLAFEVKAPLPNSDQTKVSKEKILKLYAMEPRVVDGAFYALPYNPYGKRQDYGWSFPKRWFNMVSDEVVLIGDEFWDKVGGPGTYQDIIEALEELGADYKERIYREYLEIEPPK